MTLQRVKIHEVISEAVGKITAKMKAVVASTGTTTMSVTIAKAVYNYMPYVGCYLLFEKDTGVKSKVSAVNLVGTNYVLTCEK